LKNNCLIVIILTILSLIVLSSGCTDSGGNKSYENNEISFDYPAGWETSSNFYYDRVLNASEVAEILDPESGDFQLKYTTLVRIERKNMTSGQNLKQIFNNTYSAFNQSNIQFISENNTTVDGAIAYEKVYKMPHGEPWYQIRDVWLEKNGKIYIICCWTLPGNFEKVQKDFDMIINSFHVK
jgi:sulfatase maturation enzyme AslB (radical SAM superfamily)